MKTILTIVLVHLAIISFAQKKLPGLYGECKGLFYLCQQVVFRADSSFEFYDLLHMRGWKITKGTWKQHGDTIVLNSLIKPYEVVYVGNSINDNISIKFISDSLPLGFSTVFMDTSKFNTDSNGTFFFSKKTLDTLSLSYLFAYRGPIIFDKAKLMDAESVEVRMVYDYDGIHYFDNVKWLFSDKRLYYSVNKEGAFDKERFFINTKMRNLKYQEETD
jgi:hypothetical protein